MQVVWRRTITRDELIAALKDLMQTAWADRHNVVDLIEGYGREIGVEI